MEKQNKLPDVIFMSPKASEFLKTQITDYCACIEYDGKGIDIKDWSSSKEVVANGSLYRNISQLWHPAEEKPYSIGQILCRCSNGLLFVHHHYSDVDIDWRIFVRCNNVECYCYIQDLRP